MGKSFDKLYDRDEQNDPFIVEYRDARRLLHTADWRQGLHDLEVLADRGSIMSILLVADAMRDGWLYDQDLPGAEKWFRAVAQAGWARGHFGLGLTHLLMGHYSEAIEDLQKAIELKFPPAYNSLAGIYFRGDGVKVDKTKAKHLWLAGMSLGHMPAKRNLVQLSLHGNYGLTGILFGVLNLLPVAYEIAMAGRMNPSSDRLR